MAELGFGASVTARARERELRAGVDRGGCGQRSGALIRTRGKQLRGVGDVDEQLSSWQRLKTTKGDNFTEPPENWKIKAKGSFCNKNCREINYLGAFLNS